MKSRAFDDKFSSPLTFSHLNMGVGLILIAKRQEDNLGMYIF